MTRSNLIDLDLIVVRLTEKAVLAEFPFIAACAVGYV